MKRFADLYASLDSTTRTTEKVAAMERYFREAPAADAAWAVHFLSGERPKRLVRYADLRTWAAEAAELPDWLFEECYQAVGDLAEAVALVVGGRGRETVRVPEERTRAAPLHRWVEDRLLPLRNLDRGDQRRELLGIWAELDERQTFVWNKLITGAFRVGVSRKLVTRALAAVSGLDEAVLAHRLMGSWQPSAGAFEALLAADTSDADVSRPYPFFLAHPVELDVPAEGAGQAGGAPSPEKLAEQLTERLGEPRDWQAEWKWDGIRAQLVRRSGRTFLWSRGEELITERFPELGAAATKLPDGTVLDGEVMAWRGDEPLPFAALQRRIGRKRLGEKILAEVPAALVAYDLLEEGAEDLRERPLAERRARLETLVREELPDGGRIRLSPTVEAADWAGLVLRQRAAREMRAEGLMLKRLDSTYGVGRRKGAWWKWKADPHEIDAVLLYAQRGHGRRASLYTDYTFGVWSDDELVPIAKAYSGLTDDEIREVDRFVRRNTRERFGPVRAVEPRLVFQLHFEGIRESGRHKSGVALRFPRMARWRRDKPPEEADTLETVQALLGDP